MIMTRTQKRLEDSRRNKVTSLGWFLFAMIFFALFLAVLLRDIVTTKVSSPRLDVPGSPQAQVRSFSDLLDAIEQVESRGVANAVGDGGRSIGAYQLSKAAVDDVNLYLQGFEAKLGLSQTTYYTYEDRLDKSKSRRIAEWYIKRWTSGRGGYRVSLEAKARIFNGGPNGWCNDPDFFIKGGYTRERAENKIANTKAYWAKIEKAMK